MSYKNIENRKEYLKQYYKNNPEKFYNLGIKKQRKEYYKNNREKILKQSKQWQKDNYKEMKKYHNHWERIKDRTDLNFKLKKKMRTSIWYSLKKNKGNKTWRSLVGYTLNDLIKRLNETMPVGYTWKDYLSGELHIDHIIPIDAFNFTRPEHTDFKKCWALSNLRLLLAKENLIKSNRLIRPFQPALRI
ncbi:hypothetical protein ES708_28857 [subsurface metagenome]